MKTAFKISLGLLFVLCNLQTVAFAKVEAVLGALPLSSNANLTTPLPTTNASEILISRDQYLISYNKQNRAPNWVAWKIEEKDLGTTPRSRDFFTDQELETYLTAHNAGHAVTPWDYDGSCFDRGHQAPSADRTDSQQDNDATFMMSNIIPQTPYLNRVIWEHLEVYTRKLVKQGKTVYAIAGPIYDQNFGAIGPQKDIPVPSKNFKILVIQDTASAAAAPQIIAVVMPNTAEDGSVPHPGHCAAFSEEATPNVNDWMKYKASVADIEKMTGLSFQLP